MRKFWKRSKKPGIYSPLKTSSGEIRLLTLLPGKTGTEVCVELYTKKLKKSAPPEFEALSYTWGSMEGPVPIRVNGDNVLSVTRNLEEALQHLRDTTQPRILWIDAICVNQEDLDERSEQVARMANIYTLARQVVTWLGPASEDSPSAMRNLRKIGSMVVVNYFEATMKPSEEAERTGELQWAERSSEIALQTSELGHILAFLKRPWFERVWVRQEIRLATCAVVVCGQDSISWTAFQNAIYVLEAKKNIYASRLEETHQADWFDRISLVHGLCDNDLTRDFPSHMDRAKRSKCSDPRDRVYALLSTSDFTVQAVSIVPNYRKSVEEVYQDVFLELATKYQYTLLSFSFLTSAEPKELPSNMPTWVPNWAVERSSVSFPVFKACGMSYSMINYIGEGLLKTWGVTETKIHSSHFSGLTTSPLPGGTIIESLRRLGLQALLAIRSLSTSTTQDEIEEEQWPTIMGSVLFCNDFRDSYEPPLTDRLERQICEEVLRYFLTVPDLSRWPQHLAPDMASVTGYALQRLLCRSILVATDGRLGLGPALTKQGDEIVVMPGCKSPMVLRSCQNGRYHVVGECSFVDMVHGEAFLGPLPKHFKLVKKLTKFDNGTEPWVDFYRNTISGEDQMEDPRFDPPWHRLLKEGYGFKPSKDRGKHDLDHNHPTILMRDSMHVVAKQYEIPVPGIREYVLQ